MIAALVPSVDKRNVISARNGAAQPQGSNENEMKYLEKKAP